ncbi:hypothetical protein VPHK449_0020 [Vibrio phage K449]
MKTLFTHSYWGEGESIENVPSTYISGAKLAISDSINQRAFKAEGYFYSEWVDARRKGGGIMLMVKVSEEVQEVLDAHYLGYPSEALRPAGKLEVANLVWTGREKTIGHTVDVIPGKVNRADWYAHIESLLDLSNPEYKELWEANLKFRL